MSKNTSITLGDHFDGFVSECVQGGQYGSASEVIRAGLRLLEDQRAQTLAIRQALIEGEASGRAEYSLDGVKAALNARKPAQT